MNHPEKDAAPLAGGAGVTGSNTPPDPTSVNPSSATPAAPEAAGPGGGEPPQADRLVRLVMELYRVGQTDTGEPFAVPKSGPNVALPLEHTGGAIRDALAREHWRRHRRVMNSAACADALATLRGLARESAHEPVWIRVGPHGDGIVLDLGTIEGDAVVVDRDGWRIERRSPILFRRTPLTGPLPVPIHGGDLGALRELLNVTDETWPILLGWMVAALIPGMPHPILMLGGLQGTGKTTAARYICGLFDASGAPIRSQPRDAESWAMSIANGWTAVIDNVSAIPAWWSDALCKAVTGDGWVRRALYSNADVAVLRFRRVLALTSIDPGALRGDLGQRLVLVDLEPIEPDRRRTERELDRLYRAAHPKILGALLDLLAGVLARLDAIGTDGLPRMADFARVLAAVDAVLGTSSLKLYSDQEKRIAGEVLESDPIGEAVMRWTRNVGPWEGSAQTLLRCLKPEDAGREWPRTGRGMGASLRRLAPALAHHGIRVTPPRPTDHTRTFRLETIAQTARSPESNSGSRGAPDAPGAIPNGPVKDLPSDGPVGNGGSEGGGGDSGRSGDSGDRTPGESEAPDGGPQQ